MMAMKAVTAAAPQFEQEAISEYHLYTLERHTNIQNNETKQISLLAAAGAAVEKVFEVDGQSYYYQNAQSPGQPTKEPVKVLIKFKNAEANSLGVPLPAGTVRVYQGDSKGRVQFIGEDRIDHTPKDETVSLHIGNAFDVVAERKQTDFQRLGPHNVEVEYEISLRNHKPDPITVFVNEPIGGDWTMLNSTFKFEKTAAFAARFTVPVAADSEALLKYRVRIWEFIKRHAYHKVACTIVNKEYQSTDTELREQFADTAYCVAARTCEKYCRHWVMTEWKSCPNTEFAFIFEAGDQGQSKLEERLRRNRVIFRQIFARRGMCLCKLRIGSLGK